jgi:hypothetical protein
VQGTSVGLDGGQSTILPGADGSLYAFRHDDQNYEVRCSLPCVAGEPPQQRTIQPTPTRNPKHQRCTPLSRMKACPMHQVYRIQRKPPLCRFWRRR